MSTPWILITGNGAFGDTAERSELRYAENPSARLAALLDGTEIAGHRVVGRGLDWHRHPREALEPLLEHLEDEPPAVILATGVFSGRTTITVERTAVNVQDFQFSEDDHRPAGEPVADDGPTAYLATVPIKAMTHAIRDHGIPALVSNSASTHGCNSVMYTALHLVTTHGLPTRAGFIHLPDTPEHIASVGSNGPSMDFDLQVRAVRIAAEAAIRHPEGDLSVPANEWEW